MTVAQKQDLTFLLYKFNNRVHSLEQMKHQSVTNTSSFFIFFKIMYIRTCVLQLQSAIILLFSFQDMNALQSFVQFILHEVFLTYEWHLLIISLIIAIWPH